MSWYQLRIARPVSDLTRSREMYCFGLEFDELGRFDNHAGFSGVMLGRKAMPWHLEFTLCHHHPVTPSPGQEDLLVIYIPQLAAWQAACQRMQQAGFVRTTSFNPYWQQQGQTFIDHDGYRSVIQQQQWPGA